VGETEAAIRELFRKARENAPSIVLLDELDAIGGSRGDLGEASEQGGGGTAMERALSTLLNEMDGVGIAGPKFGSVGDGAGAVSGVPAVFLLGLTNRPELVDAALLRPGRLEQLLHVPHPNLEEREAILGVHTRHVTLGDEVNLASIAERTERFSGAALAALCRETTMQALARQWRRRRAGRPMGAKEDGEVNDNDDDGEEEEEDEEEEEEEEEGVARSGGTAAAFVEEDDMDESILVRAMDFERAGRVVLRSLVHSDQEHAKLEQRDAKFRASRTM
jgi:SpoVK/Ycf46/Vps4 family AAA+-type ATPase